MGSIERTTTLVVWNGVASPQISGGDVYVQKLLDLSGWDYSVIAPKRALDMLEVPAKETHQVDSLFAKMTWSQMLLYMKRTVQVSWLVLFTRKKHKLAIAASPFFHDLIPCLFSGSKNKAVVFFHLIPDRKSTNWRSALRFFIARVEQGFSVYLIKRYFTIVIAGNELVVDQLKAKGLAQSIFTSDAGIDTSKIDAVAKRTKKKDSILFMGRLTTQKGILDLVDVMREVSKKDDNMKLQVIGDGPHRHLLEQKIIDSGMRDKIELLGFISDEKKYKMLSGAEYFIFPSYEEGWGIALAEALYAKCKCIAYELDHYRAIFADYPQYVETGSASSMASQLLKKDEYDLSNQKDFIAKYDYHEVVRRVIISLEELTKD